VKLTYLVRTLLVLLAVSVLAGPWSAARQAGDGGGPLQATLELLRPFVYAGDPLLVRVAVFNTSDKPVANEPGMDLLGGLQVAEQKRGSLTIKKKPELDAKQQPAVIRAGGFFGVIQDITSVFPLDEPGSYTISWSGKGVSTTPVTVHVIPRFDPSAHYVAVIETDFGYLEIDLLTDAAPAHVQNFYDLAQQGFYDNTALHQIIKGVELRGGDPAGTGTGWPGYGLDPEIKPDLKHVRGTLTSVPLAGLRQDNGSQFVITLSRLAEYDGERTVFGQARDSEDVLLALENIPTSGGYEAPVYRPLKTVVVRSVKIKTAEPETKEGSGGSNR